MQFSERFWNSLVYGTGWAVVFGCVPLIGLAGLMWLQRKVLRDLFPDYTAGQMLTVDERQAFQDRWTELEESSLPLRLCTALIMAFSFPGTLLLSFAIKRRPKGVSVITTILLSVFVYVVVLALGAYARSK